MEPAFSDHFSPVAANYASFRPSYPSALFAWLAGRATECGLAWDCATGNGQASLDLATHFARVVATDASEEQIAQAPKQSRVEFRVAAAEASGLPEASVDLITVAQALHWFDLERFYVEARRVLKPEGLLAVWTYGVLEVEGSLPNELVQAFYSHTVGPYWPPERKHVESGYRTLPFPFHELQTPPFDMEAKWNLHELLGYFRTWSATTRYIKARGHDPLEALAAQLLPVWGAPESRRLVKWPLSLRVGKR